MWSRRRLDIGWRDVGYGLLRCALPRGASGEAVAGECPQPEEWLACLSVRSGLDLLLSQWALPAGSEILMSALTIPGMVRIVEDHGLVPVPVDLESDRLAPSVDAVRAAITPRSRALIVAHLFGGRIDLDPLLCLAHQSGLRVVEDAAQAFGGGEYWGHPQVDASLFSFGMIKAQTALGGALVRVGDPAVRRDMIVAQSRWRVQSRGDYFRRLIKAAALKVLSSRPAMSLLASVGRVGGWDYDRWINARTRAFPGAEFFVRIRRQPSSPLLSLLLRRLHAGSSTLEKQRRTGQLLRERLEGRICCPGAGATEHTFWAFAVLVDEPAKLLEALAAAGFDATHGHSLCVVPPPADRPGLRAQSAERILEKIVFVPAYPQIAGNIEKMAEVILSAADGSPFSATA